jgi:hypothetical protein
VIAVNIYIKDKIKSKKALIPYPSYKKGSLRALISFFENLISISLSNAYFNESLKFFLLGRHFFRNGRISDN